MDTLIKADLFFFITTVAVVVVAATIVVLAVYIIKIVRDAKYIVAKFKDLVDRAESELEDIYEEAMVIWPFKLIAKKRRDSTSRRTKDN